jgi:hypothetical protein
MRVSRRLGRALAVVVLCAAGVIGAGQAPAAFAADNDPVQSIFFGKELLAFNCIVSGGTYYESGTGYGCHMADGGEVWCDQGTCWWWPAMIAVDPKVRDILTTVVLPQVSGADPYPLPTKAGYEQVLGLNQAPKLTIDQVRLLAGVATTARIGAVDRVVAVRSRAVSLTADQIDAVMNGKTTKDLPIVGTVPNPSGSTTLGDVAARMKVAGQRVLLIRGEILVDGRSVPVLTLILLVS